MTIASGFTLVGFTGPDGSDPAVLIDQFADAANISALFVIADGPTTWEIPAAP